MFEFIAYPKGKDFKQGNLIQCFLADEGGASATITLANSEKQSNTSVTLRDPVHLRQLAAWASGSAAYLESLRP